MMDKNFNQFNEEKDYQNVGDKTTNNHSIEIKDMRLESSDRENYNSEFVVKKTKLNESSYELGEFKFKKCKNVKSIFYNDNIFTSIVNPQDNAHAFFIKLNNKNYFEYDFNNTDFDAESYQVKKREMLKEKIEEFISKINSIIQIEWIGLEAKKISFFKTLIYFLLIVFIILLSYFSLLILFYFIAALIGSNNTNDSVLGKIFDIGCVFLIFGVIYVLLRYLKHFRLKEIFLIFAYIMKKKQEIDDEIEYWNTSVFNPNSMKAQMAETFDYIQIYYDMKIVYEMERHDFGTTDQLKENVTNV